MNTIVLGSNHNNTLGLIWSLAEAGHKVTLLLYSHGNNYVAKSKYITKTYLIDSNNDDVIQLIIDIAKGMNEKPVVFVSSDNDAALLNENYSILSHYCFLEGGNDDGSINQYRDKDVGNTLAEKCGFIVPKNIVINRKKQIRDLPLSFPVIIKANNSIYGGKAAMQKCNSVQESIDFAESLPDNYYPLQVQEFIEKEYEIMLLGCSLDKGNTVVCPIANRKIRQYPRPTGLGSYSESIAVRHQADLEKLSERTAQYLREINYTGLFSAEFLYCKGTYYFLEINLRNDGTSWLSTCSGYNLPDMVCRSFEGKKQEEELSFKKKYYMNIIADAHYVKDGSIGLFRWIKLFNNMTCYSHMNFKDFRPFLFYLVSIIIRK